MKRRSSKEDRERVIREIRERIMEAKCGKCLVAVRKRSPK